MLPRLPFNRGGLIASSLDTSESTDEIESEDARFSPTLGLSRKFHRIVGPRLLLDWLAPTSKETERGKLPGLFMPPLLLLLLLLLVTLVRCCVKIAWCNKPFAKGGCP